MRDNGAAPALDLGAVAADHPPRRVYLPIRRLIGDGLVSNGDLAYAAQLAGVSIERMQALGADGQIDPATAELLYRLAWVIALRADPSVRWEEARGWQLVVDVSEGPRSDPTPPDGGLTTT